MLPARTLGILFVSASAVAWSTTGLFTRILPLDGATLLVWRGAFGALGLIAVIAAFRLDGGLAGFARLGRAGWAYAVLSGAGMICFIAALRLTTVAHVAIIYAAAPLIAAALAWLAMRERPGRSAVIASIIALAGGIYMVGLGDEGDLVGDLLALGMTTAVAGMMVMGRRFPRIPTTQAACASAALSALAALPFAAALSVTPHELGILAAFGITNSALGLTLFLLGSRYLPAIETALISALDAPLAPLWVWLFFAESPSQATMIGGAIVFTAILGHIGQDARKPAPPHA